jgi:antitoxin MazE
MQVSKWGNSLAIRLPAKVVKSLGLREGDEVEIVASAGGRLEIAKDDMKELALAQLRQLRRPFPVDFRFDRAEANDRESLP